MEEEGTILVLEEGPLGKILFMNVKKLAQIWSGLKIKPGAQMTNFIEASTTYHMLPLFRTTQNHSTPLPAIRNTYATTFLLLKKYDNIAAQS